MEAPDTIGRRERKKLELEQRIRQAAAELFHGKGYDATTVDEIADAADVAKATLFNYFPRKDALLLAVWEDQAEASLASLGPPETWEGTGPEQIRRLFHVFAEDMQRMPQLARVILLEAMRNWWTQGERLATELEFRELVERLVRESQARGELAADADPRIGAAMLRELFAMTVMEWLREEKGMTVKEELDARFEVVFRGLGYGRGKGGAR
jgi:TetR/AcrR family transcriptional regulator, cholesterol catabolism regulator